MNPRILVLLQYYLPGDKSGGPVRTIEGMVSRLSTQFDWDVISYDRDSGDDEPFPNVQAGAWRREGEARVLAIPRNWRKWFRIARVVREAPRDLLYLQSLFNPCFTIWPLFLIRLGLGWPSPVLLAPRGELAEGALALKNRKKKIFLTVARWMGLFRGLHWHASTDLEREEIVGSGLADPERVHVATNLRRQSAARDRDAGEERPGEEGGLRVVFLSRITAKKNLRFALEVIRRTTRTVRFDIYGPVDRDRGYWESCEMVMRDMPANVVVRYHGALEHDRVEEVLQGHDLLFLPTRGENYGHVLIEALLAGCPVLTSDRTPWRGMEARRAGFDLSLDEPDAFLEALHNHADLSADERVRWRRGAQKAGREFADAENARAANERMLLQLIGEQPR